MTVLSQMASITPNLSSTEGPSYPQVHEGFASPCLFRATRPRLRLGLRLPRILVLDRSGRPVDRVDSLRAGKLGVVGRNGWYTEDRMLNTWYILASRWGLA